MSHLLPCLVLLVTAASADRSLGGDEVGDLVAALYAWEQASADAPELFQQQPFAAHNKTHSAHELQAAAQLFGRVSARRLIEKYQWSLRPGAPDAVDEPIVLVASPRDDVDRLFYSEVTVRLDASGHLTSLQFRDPRGRLRADVLSVAESPADRDDLAAGARRGGLIRLAANLADSDEESSAVTVDLATLLAEWERATREIRECDIQFSRSRYDLISQIEYRAKGRFYFEAPNRGLYAVEPVEVSGGRSERTGNEGERFQLQSESSGMWFWNGENLVVVDPEDKMYNEFAVPATQTGTVRQVGSWDRLWYSLAAPQRSVMATVDVHSEEFLRRFDWSLLERKGDRVTLEGRPIAAEDRLEIDQLQVVLDTETHLAKATRVVAAGGNLETLHVFQYRSISRSIESRSVAWEPDLSGFRKLNPAPLAPPAAMEERQGEEEEREESR